CGRSTCSWAAGTTAPGAARCSAAAAAGSTSADGGMRAREDRALYSQTVEIRTADVLRKRTGARRVRHDEHVVGIAFVLADVGLQVIDDQRNVLTGCGAAALDGHTDHAAVRR